jgi:hypothetical protein
VVRQLPHLLLLPTLGRGPRPLDANYRRGAGEWHEHTIPDFLSDKLIHLLRSLGLHYGCIDLRQRPDGEYVFFEVNPSGQWLFVEVDTGQPLALTCAELLSQPYRLSH